MDQLLRYYYAVTENKIKELRDLIGDKRNVCDDIKPYDESLLYHAALKGHAPIVKLLLENGCSPNVRNIKGYTPLHAASLNSFTEVAKQLLTYGANVDDEDNFGNTPLMEAVFSFKDDLSIVELLVSYGADPSHRNMSGISPIKLAMDSSRLEIVELFRSMGPN